MPFLTDEANLFVIELTYKVAIDAVEPHLAAHRNFLDQHYQAGHFLASGAKVPARWRHHFGHGAHQSGHI